MFPEANSGYWEYGTGGFPRVGGSQENLLDGFEDGDIDGYGGDLSDFYVQRDNVLKGRHTLQSTDSFSMLADGGGDYPTPRTDDPIEYRAHVYSESTGEVMFCTNVQSEVDSFRNCYFFLADVEDNELRFGSREDGSSDYFEIVNMNLSSGREYILFITLTTDGINGGIRDSNGSELYRSESYYDTTHNGGGIGWRTGVGSVKYFDHATFHPGSMSELQSYTIDDFETGNINPYYKPSTSGDRRVVPRASFEGDYGLELDGFTWMLTTPGDGLENYIRDGEPFEFYFNPRVTGSQQYWVFLCPQSRTSRDNSYTLQFIMSGTMRIQKDGNTLSGSGSGEPNYAFTNEVSWSQYNWYRARVWVDGTDGIRAELYDESSGNYLAYVESDDTQYISSENGLGWYSSGSGRVYYDEMRETR